MAKYIYEQETLAPEGAEMAAGAGLLGADLGAGAGGTETHKTMR